MNPVRSEPLQPGLAQTGLGQRLPITARATINGQVIRLEVARTPSEQAMGLMYRTNLPKNRGMLFPFDPPRAVQFWMQNVPISLDIVFIRKNKVKAIAANVPPCKGEDCPTYGPQQAVDRVLELRNGRSAQLGLKVGDTIRIRLS